MKVIFLQGLKGLFTRTPVLAVLLLTAVVAACAGPKSGGPKADCIFAEDEGTKNCGLIALPQFFNYNATYNITVGKETTIGFGELGLSNFTFTQIINGNISDPKVVTRTNNQIELLANATALNLNISGIDDNVFGEFYIDLVQHNNTAVTVRYTISITAVNDAPVFSAVRGSESQFDATATPARYDFADIPLNSTAGYSVANVSTTDVDNDTISYSISGGTNVTNLFQINQATGEITLKKVAVNAGSSPIPYTFIITASDGKGGSVTTEITVMVLTDNQAPVFRAVRGSGQFTEANETTATPANYNFADIPFNSAIDYPVGNVLATDTDGGTVGYSISGETDDNALFQISSTGAITLKAQATNSGNSPIPYTFNLIANDGQGGTATATISVEVLPTLPPVFSAGNSPRVGFTLVDGATPANYIFAGILQNSSANDLVGNVSAMDLDGGTVSYSITGGTDDTALFQIISTTGEITLKDIADTLGTYQFNVIASDGQGGTATATISVKVLSTLPPVFEEGNSPGVQFTSAAGATPANYDFAMIPPDSLADYSVGNVSATDPEGEAITYSITGGTEDNALFMINQMTGEITLKTTVTDIAEYQFNVIASDGQEGTATATIYVTVGDPTPPVFNSASYEFDLSLSVTNAAGVVLGNVLAVDEQGTLFDYSLAGSDTLFELATDDNPDGTRNIILRRAVTLSDFAAFPITFQVVATHQGSMISSDAPVTVNFNSALSLDDDSDADGIANFYDADPNDAAVNVIGNGESDDPYIISNIYQLQAIAGVDHTGMPLDSSSFTSYVFLYGTDAADQLTKHYKLANDIDASNTTDNAFWAKPAVGSNSFIGHGWTPIAGGENQEFNGSFAGDGYHIHNLNMNLQVANNKDTFGLFGTNGGNISAVGLTNINMQIAAINGSFINNTSLAGNGETDSYTLGSGALVGTNSEGGSIKYAYSTGIVTVDGLYTGGLVGVNIGNVAYSYSTATVTGRRYTGGLVGTFGVPAVTSAEVASSYATGNVTTKFRGTENFGPGGLVGTIAQRSTPLSANIHASYAGNAKESVKFDNELRGLGVGGPLIGILSTGYNLNISYSFWTNSTLTTEETRVQFHTNLGGIYTLNALDLSGNNVEDEIFPIEPTQFMNCGLNECPFNPPSILFPSPHWDPNFDDPGIARGWIFEIGKYPALYANRTLNSVTTSLMPSLEAQDCHRIQVSDACGTYDAAE